MIKIKEGFSGERAIVLPKMIVDIMEKDPLDSVLHITDIGYYPKARFHFRERKEPIDEYVFIYCVDGIGWFRLNGQRYDVRTNQYFILPAGIPHAYGSDESVPWTIYWIHFKGTLAGYYAGDIREAMDITPGVNSRISDRIEMFEEIFHTLSSGYSNENMRYVSSIFHYFLGSLRYINQYRDANNSHSEDRNMIEMLIHYMKENIEKHITLHDIASFLGYSPSHISMVFKKNTGHSPMAYLNLLKIQQACLLLDSTDMKINQVCYKVGIDDAYYFSRLFSKMMGMSPRDYKQLKKG